MDRIIALVSLIVSVVAITLAGVTFANSEKRAQSVLDQRERQLIQHLFPTLQTIYSDFDLAVPSQPPKTLEELFDPLVGMIESIASPALHVVPPDAG